MGVAGHLQYTPSKVVIHALKDIKRPKGVSFEEILSYAVGKYKVNQNSFKTALKHALKRGLKYRILEVHNNRYKLSNSHQKLHNKISPKEERQWRKAASRVAKKGLKSAKKKINSVKRRNFRPPLRKGKHKMDKASFRIRRRNLEVTARRRAKSELLRSRSRDPSRLG